MAGVVDNNIATVMIELRLVGTFLHRAEPRAAPAKRRGLICLSRTSPTDTIADLSDSPAKRNRTHRDSESSWPWLRKPMLARKEELRLVVDYVMPAGRATVEANCNISGRNNHDDAEFTYEVVNGLRKWSDVQIVKGLRVAHRQI